ncbi:MAG: methyltransferase domain-containing protein [Bacteroidota bacterium]
MVGAIALRLVALPMGPVLSDDAYRYLWDGRLIVAGENPFAATPETLPAPLRAQIDPTGELYEEMNSRGYFSVYPPPSQALFALAGVPSWLSAIDAFRLYKLLLTILECVALYVAARFLSAGLVALYAWHPLPIIEIAGQGHTEGVFVGFALIGLACLRQERVRLGALALTVAAWAKLVPLVALPFVLLKHGMRAFWMMVLVTVLLWVPFAHPATAENIATSLRLYVQLFEFNAGPYLLVKETARWFTGADYSKVIGPTFSLVFFGVIAAGFVAQWRTARAMRWPAPTALLVVLGAFLLCTTTVHPWYLLMPLAVLPFAWDEGSEAIRTWSWGWWWMSLFVAGTYGFYVGERGLALLSGTLGWLVLLGASALALLQAVSSSRWGQQRLDAVLRQRGRSKWSWIAEALGESDGAGARLLDLGAGEGWVGWAAHQTGYQVALADVVDLNQTELTHIRYDGHALPFPAATFDATVLVFVLHHAEHTEAVLREARRTLKPSGRLAVVESVYTNPVNHALLRFLDTRANRLRGEGQMEDQEAHLAFDTVEGWRRRFQEVGFRVEAERRRGRLIHRQHLFVLRPTGDAPSSGS